jgi:hypothetical protein
MFKNGVCDPVVWAKVIDLHLSFNTTLLQGARTASKLFSINCMKGLEQLITFSKAPVILQAHLKQSCS